MVMSQNICGGEIFPLKIHKLKVKTLNEIASKLALRMFFFFL